MGRPYAGANEPAAAKSKQLDLLCFSHLRWDFVFQRPQHLLSRAAKTRRVFFWEEPMFMDIAAPTVELHDRDGVCVVQPFLPQSSGPEATDRLLEGLLAGFLQAESITEYVVWYYTPMALAFTGRLEPAATVYDCMDELSAFKNAPPELKQREAELLRRADVVFTGGRSLYDGKAGMHGNVHLFPSSIDKAHFESARTAQPDPPDQQAIAHPRVGFFGVLDERLDRELLAEVARVRPQMQFVMLGPVVKIRPEDLPQAPNIHYLGQKTYKELPAYISGWSAAILPFALNASTAYISPTKTPEYLAAGRAVVSTPIRDVVREYGEPGLVAIASTPQQFAEALDSAVQPAPAAWLPAVDQKLASSSWDETWRAMSHEIDQVLLRNQALLRENA